MSEAGRGRADVLPAGAPLSSAGAAPGASEVRSARFSAALAEISGSTIDAFETLRREADVDRWQGARRASSLNNDAFPLQACISIGSKRRRVRLIADPAAGDPDPRRRLERAWAALARWTRDRPGFGDAVRDALEPALPAPGALHDLVSGALWIASDPDRGEIAAYTTARWGAQGDRWPRSGAWAAPAAPRPTWSAGTEPVSLGVEGRSASQLVSKVYFRLVRPRPLDELDVDFGHSDFARFLRLAVGAHSLRRSGLLLSVAHRRSDGAVLGRKVDVCAHCTPRSRAGWSELLARLESTFELPVAGLSRALEDGALELVYVGFGLDHDGARRLNLYVEPGEA